MVERAQSSKKWWITGMVVAVVGVGVLVFGPRVPDVARGLRWHRVAQDRANGAIDERDVPDLVIHLSALAPGAFSLDVPPRFFFGWHTPDGVRYVLGAPIHADPEAPLEAMRFTRETLPSGRLYLRMCLFTDEGDLLSMTDLPLGQQSRLASVKLKADRPAGVGCLEVETISTLRGDRFRQYLAPIDGQWGLLRLTRVRPLAQEVRPHANIFAPAEQSMAPARRFRTIDELHGELRHEDVRRVLPALHWLVGRHESRQYKSRSADASLVERAWADDRIRTAVDALATHPDPWVREALALGEERR